jgi:hypothetical protein
MVVEPDDVTFLPVKVTHLLIGASPDAIIDHETVLEIKCPVNNLCRTALLKYFS